MNLNKKIVMKILLKCALLLQALLLTSCVTQDRLQIKGASASAETYALSVGYAEDTELQYGMTFLHINEIDGQFVKAALTSEKRGYPFGGVPRKVPTLLVPSGKHTIRFGLEAMPRFTGTILISRQDLEMTFTGLPGKKYEFKVVIFNKDKKELGWGCKLVDLDNGQVMVPMQKGQ